MFQEITELCKRISPRVMNLSKVVIVKRNKETRIGSNTFLFSARAICSYGYEVKGMK